MLKKKVVLGFAFVLISFVLLSFAGAVVSHQASQIQAGTFGIGDFTFNGSLNVLNSAGSSLFFVNCASNNVGIGTASPTHKLNIVGDTNITGNLIVGGIYQEVRL